MKKKKENIARLPMRPLKKVLLVLLGAALVFAAVYGVYYLFRYTLEDRYKAYKTTYEYEAGTEFTPLKESAGDVPGFVLVSENETLKLYTKTETAEIAVYDKRNGKITYSNPQDADSDPIANKTNTNYLKSQFILTYFNKNAKTGIYDSYSMSTERGQVTWEGIQNGIRYIYDVGNYEKSATGIVPLYLTPEKYEEVQARMTEKVNAGEMTEKDFAALLRYYVDSTNVPGMWELNSAMQKNIKAVQKLASWFDLIEWTEEEYIEQMEIAGVEVAVPISFKVVLEYRLQNDGILVSIPTCALEEKGGGYFNRIQLLNYMGAADSSEEGYMVVPNASGSLIYFNNGKTNVPSYTQYIYDIDPLLANYTQIENTNSAKLPLFGICRSDSTILATVEDGQSLAMLTAGVSGVYHNYNYAYSTFVIRSADNLVNFGESSTEVYVMEPNFYDVNLSVRYSFLTEENSGYSGIANYYRNRLISEGKLARNSESGDIPLYYDIIGAAKETRHILGTRVLRTTSMTTFEQAKQLAEELSGLGVSNQVMNYQGWFNGGYYHDAADTIKVLRKLGGKSGLSELNSYMRELGGKLYADVAFQKVSFADDGFNYSAESSRYYGAGFVVSFGKVNPTTLRSTSSLDYPEIKYDLLSPKFLPYYVEKFADKIQKVDVDGISLRDLGNTLQSDKKRTNIINREEAYDIVVGQFDTLKATGKNLMVDAGFDYSFAYADDIINAPMDDNAFFIVDEDIPLYEMILHGCVSYSSDLLNFYDQSAMDETVLRLIEYGAAPHYVFTWDESNELKNTGLNNFYCTTFASWKQSAADTYKAVNEVLKNVSGATVEKHEILTEQVRAVTYDNGVRIYVNYGTTSAAVDGVTVPAMGTFVEGVK